MLVTKARGRDVGERITTPQVNSDAKIRAGGGRVIGAQGIEAGATAGFERRRVQFVRVDVDPVPACGRGKPRRERRAEQVAEPVEVGVQCGARVARRVVGPHGIDEFVDGDVIRCAQQECGKDRAQLRCRDRAGRAAVMRVQGAEHTEPDLAVHAPPRDRHHAGTQQRRRAKSQTLAW